MVQQSARCPSILWGNLYYCNDIGTWCGQSSAGGYDGISSRLTFSTSHVPWRDTCCSLAPSPPLLQSQNLGLLSVTCAHLELKPWDPVPANKTKMKVTGKCSSSPQNARTCWRKLFGLHTFNLLLDSCLETGSNAWRHNVQLGAMSIKFIVKMAEQRREEYRPWTSLPIIHPPHRQLSTAHPFCLSYVKLLHSFSYRWKISCYLKLTVSPVLPQLFLLTPLVGY